MYYIKYNNNTSVTMYNVHCTMYTVQCTLYITQYVFSNNQVDDTFTSVQNYSSST